MFDLLEVTGMFLRNAGLMIVEGSLDESGMFLPITGVETLECSLYVLGTFLLKILLDFLGRGLGTFCPKALLDSLQFQFS